MMRSDLSCRLPSFCWKTTSPNFFLRSASGILLSRCQKNSASLNRGVITRWFPSRIISGDLLSILVTAIKQGSKLFSLSTTGKYFCCPCMVAIKTSFGKARYFLSKTPENTTGHSTNAVTSSSKSLSRIALPFASAATFSTAFLISVLRRSKSAITLPVSSSCWR